MIRPTLTSAVAWIGAAILLATAVGAADYPADIRPLLAKYCLDCHGGEEATAGIRLDQLDGTLPDNRIRLWDHILSQITTGEMPPEDEPQPSAAERKSLTTWMASALTAAKSRERPKNGNIRRLTVTQYRNTLHDLLGLREDLTETLPPDGVSKDGFTNNSQDLTLLPLQVEAYFQIAQQALDRCIVDPDQPPTIQNFRVDLGERINPAPIPDQLILGANSHLLANPDFIVTQLSPTKSFPFQPFQMQTKFRFIEGYRGNDTVRGWRSYDSIYHAVFACMRGTPGYPKGAAFELVPRGLLLRPAIPSPEIFGKSNTYGPKSNFKISLRELPDSGNFRVTVQAARYTDALHLNANDPVQSSEDSLLIESSDELHGSGTQIKVAAAGLYQFDLEYLGVDPNERLQLRIGESSLGGLIPVRVGAKVKDESQAATLNSPFLVAQLPTGSVIVRANLGNNSRFQRFRLTRIKEEDPLAARFRRFEQRSPILGVHVGLRRDCGSTLTQVGVPRRVSNSALEDFVFVGAIQNYPSPDVEKDNVNYLAGIREIGVRHEYTDGRDVPRLLIKSVEFEGPFYETWPPESHRRIFIEGDRGQPSDYAAAILRNFARRAFRGPPSSDELDFLHSVWSRSFKESGDFRGSIKDALLVALTSPQFLFLIENSESPAGEPLDSFELASKLSYFLWNSAPDEELLDLAARQALLPALDEQATRLIADQRFEQFVQVFTEQWLRLDKFDVVETDDNKFPRLTRDTKIFLRQEPAALLRHLIRENRPPAELIRADYVLANEVTADYYDLEAEVETGFDFVPVPHKTRHLGGLLTQASLLTGLSNGRESNPVKRGAWLARKIVAEPPDDPPPNVPQLPEDAESHLSLREKLERHRNQKGCVKCHSGIDPWGLPFEEYDAAGRFRELPSDQTTSLLPDGTEVTGVHGLQTYLSEQRLDQVTFSFLKHIATYAVGRTLTYNELALLRREAVELRDAEAGVQDLLRFVIKSNIFLQK